MPILSETHRVLDVAFAGGVMTRSRKVRVLTSFVKYGMARKSSKMPAGATG